MGVEKTEMNLTGQREWIEKLVAVHPTENQLRWQKLEFTAFFHYGINSFTNREWGDGTEDISIFHPGRLDTDQWCRALKDAEIKACIITAKHHDGFCLWNTKYTEHSVMHTPFARDIVAELAASCRKYGIKLGVYLSPWDRHEASYGSGQVYDDFFCGQLTELLTQYGELYTVWFDGACGEGPNGKKQQYDWNRYYDLIRKYQPDAVISVSGSDVRWCGNEAGDCRESEWSVVPARLFSQKAIAEASQQSDNAEFRERRIDEQDRDLGSRDALKGETELIWYPAEVDTSIRPGWFHHDTEDVQVRPLKELTDIYVKSVGGNSVLLLNIPPHRDGYLTEADVNRLHEIGGFIRDSFGSCVENCRITASEEEEGYAASHLNADDETSWKPLDYHDGASVTIGLPKCTPLKFVSLKEQIAEGQRVERFRIETEGRTVYSGTTIGYQKLVPLMGLPVKEIRVVFEQARKCPVMNCIRLFQ